MTKDRQRLLQIAIGKMPAEAKRKAREAGFVYVYQSGSSIFASGDRDLATGSVKRLIALPFNKPR